MNLDLAASQRRLQQRSKEASEKARRQQEKEKALRDRQAVLQAKAEEEQRARRLAQLAAEEEERLRAEAELAANAGVVYRARLMAVPAPPAIAADKGIKRADDKVLLPPSAGESLMAQFAYKNSQMLFRLSAPGTGRATHAGVLEFSAAEGFVALPRAVVRSLWGAGADEATCAGPVDVAYAVLPKGTRAAFQPRAAGFHAALGDGVREALEDSLHRRCTLSEGDWVEVADGKGCVHDVRVTRLEPAQQVCVVDTELEAEVGPSLETEERLRQEEAEARAAQAAAAADAALRAAEHEEEAQRAEEEAARRQVHAARAAAALPPEPPEGAEAASVLLRLPDGGRHSRRFARGDPLQAVFDFADSAGASGCYPGRYRLVTQYPRRVFSAAQARETLSDLGLAGGREVLFLEPEASAQQQQQQ